MIAALKKTKPTEYENVSPSKIKKLQSRLHGRLKVLDAPGKVKASSFSGDTATCTSSSDSGALLNTDRRQQHIHLVGNVQGDDTDVTTQDRLRLMHLYAGHENSASSKEVAARKIHEQGIHNALDRGHVEQAVFLRMLNEDIPLILRGYDTKHLKSPERIAKTNAVLGQLYEGGPYREPSREGVLEIIARFEATAAQTGTPDVNDFVLYGTAGPF